jgi:ankyrin repeat protein
MFILYIIMIILLIYLIDDTQFGHTSLHYTVSSGNYDSAQLLIQAGADVDIQSNVSTLYDHIVHHHDHTDHISY